MPDGAAKDVFGQAAVWLGGGGVLAALGVFLKGFLTGVTGQEKEMREDLRTEVQRLAADLGRARDEIDEVRQSMARLHTLYLYVLTGRAESRAALNALERLHGVPPTAWPDDPKEGT